MIEVIKQWPNCLWLEFHLISFKYSMSNSNTLMNILPSKPMKRSPHRNRYYGVPHGFPHIPRSCSTETSIPLGEIRPWPKCPPRRETREEDLLHVATHVDHLDHRLKLFISYQYIYMHIIYIIFYIHTIVSYSIYIYREREKESTIFIKN